MATAAQIEANRRNAQKSTGPRTAAGKEVVAQNAMRHGLCAERVVVLDERAEDYAAFAAGIPTALAPADEYETALAERIVQCEWRLRRAWRMEAAAIDEAADARRRSGRGGRPPRSRLSGAEIRRRPRNAAAVVAQWSDGELQSFADPAPDDGAAWTDRLAPISRYEAALERQLHRAALALERRQAERRAAVQPAPQPRAATPRRKTSAAAAAHRPAGPRHREFDGTKPIPGRRRAAERSTDHLNRRFRRRSVLRLRVLRTLRTRMRAFVRRTSS